MPLETVDSFGCHIVPTFLAMAQGLHGNITSLEGKHVANSLPLSNLAFQYPEHA